VVTVFVNDLHLLHPLSASEHTIIFGDFNVNRKTAQSLYEKVVQHFKTNDQIIYKYRSTG
jgi:hypothetical protein